MLQIEAEIIPCALRMFLDVWTNTDPGISEVEDAKREYESMIRKKESNSSNIEEAIVKELVELIAKSLVDNPDEVRVSQLSGESSSIFELKVTQEDVGKVIGKQGRNAQAIRVILGAAGMKLKKRFNLEILEKE